MKMGFLPRARALVSGEAPLGGPEPGTVHDAAASGVERGRMDLVQHLVEHHHLDEVAGDARVVERRVDPDHLLIMKVDAHLDRAAPPSRAAATPADPRAHRAVELASVQRAVDV